MLTRRTVIKGIIGSALTLFGASKVVEAKQETIDEPGLTIEEARGYLGGTHIVMSDDAIAELIETDSLPVPYWDEFYAEDETVSMPEWAEGTPYANADEYFASIKEPDTLRVPERNEEAHTIFREFTGQEAPYKIQWAWEHPEGFLMVRAQAYQTQRPFVDYIYTMWDNQGNQIGEWINSLVLEAHRNDDTNVFGMDMEMYSTMTTTWRHGEHTVLLSRIYYAK